MENPEKIEIEGLKTIHKLCKFGADHNMEGCSFTEIVERMFVELQAAKASVVEGFALFDGEELTYSNGYSVKCEFDEQFDCHIFDVYKDGDCIKDGMTQMAQAHHLVVSMIQVEAQEPSHD